MDSTPIPEIAGRREENLTEMASLYPSRHGEDWLRGTR
jgi:hypothetical protein